MSIEVVEYYEAEPHWQVVEQQFNAQTFGSDRVVVDEGGEPQSKKPNVRRRASAAIIRSGDQAALALNTGYLYDVEIQTPEQEHSFRLGAEDRVAVLQLRPGTRVVDVHVDGESVDVDEWGDDPTEAAGDDESDADDDGGTDGADDAGDGGNDAAEAADDA